MTVGAQNIHKLASTLRRLEHEAATGTCALRSCHRPAAGFVSDWSGRPKGICAIHIPGAVDLGYEVHCETEVVG